MRCVGFFCTRSDFFPILTLWLQISEPQLQICERALPKCEPVFVFVRRGFVKLIPLLQYCELEGGIGSRSCNLSSQCG